MRFILTFVALVGIAASQDNLPDCAKTCVAKFTSGSLIAGCQSLDYVCICTNPTFLSDIACCLAAPGACNLDDQTSAVAYAKSFCGLAGVTNLPASVGCASTSTTAGAAATGTSSASTASTTPTPNVGSHNVGQIGAALLGAAVVFL